MKEYKEEIYRKGFFLLKKNYLIEEALKEITYENINFTLEEKNILDNYCIDNGLIFLRGICYIFAYALHMNFNYDIYVLNDGTKKIHWFCKTTYKGEDVFIDVRGITNSEEELISGMIFNDNKNYIIELYKDIENDFGDEYFDLGFVFAEDIINQNRNYYEVN